MASLAVVKWQIDLYPRDRYGQCGSAGGMTASIAGAAMGPVCGLFFDWVKDYRYIYVWPAVFYFCAACGAWLTYREWKALGGENYKAP
jgi:hypothetical protein